MTDANAFGEIGWKVPRGDLRRRISEEVLSSLVKDSELYGVPFTTNTWFMYYDKSVFF